MRYVVLAILAQILAVGVDNRRGVVIDAGDLLFVDGHDQNHPVFASDLLHQLDGWTIGDLLDRFVPAGLLLGAEVGSREDLLHAKDLDSLLGGLIDEAHVFLYVRLLDLVDRLVDRTCIGRLYQSAFNNSRHSNSVTGVRG